MNRRFDRSLSESVHDASSVITSDFIQCGFQLLDDMNQGQRINLKNMNLLMTIAAVDQRQFQNEESIELLSTA